MGYEERPVFAIPALRIEVTAHQAESKRCPTCGTRTQGTLPVGVPQAGQYGREVKTCAAYLSNPHHLPVERTAQIFADLGHQPICDATVLKASADLSEAGGNTRRRSIG